MEARVLYIPPEILVFADEILEDGVLSEWKLRNYGEPIQVSGYLAGVLTVSHLYNIKSKADLENFMCVIQTTLLYGDKNDAGGLDLDLKRYVKGRLEYFSIDKYGEILRFKKALKFARKWGGKLYPSPMRYGMESRFGISVKMKG